MTGEMWGIDFQEEEKKDSQEETYQHNSVRVMHTALFKKAW